MSKGLEKLKKLAYENACCRCQYYIDKKCTNKHECIWLDIKKELTDYAEIKEIAKHYHWEDLANDVFKVETDRKWQLNFESAICDVQEDYKKARAFDILKNKGVFVHLLQQSKNVEEYNSLILIAFKKMAERDYKGVVEKFCLTQEEFNLLKEVLL